MSNSSSSSSGIGIIICGGLLAGVVTGLFALLGAVFNRRKRRPFR